MFRIWLRKCNEVASGLGRLRQNLVQYHLISGSHITLATYTLEMFKRLASVEFY